MAGKATPGAVHSADFSNPFLAGPLAWMIDPSAPGVAANAPIFAIWRNEVGTAIGPIGQTSS